MVEIIPTVVPRTLDDVESAVERYSKFAKTLHVDIADGNFASNTTWMPKEYESFPALSMRIEVHLMINDPLSLVQKCIKAGAKTIIVHVEALNDIEDAIKTLKGWKKAGVQIGIAILLETPLTDLDPFLDVCDLVHMMSIAEIGEQGAPFDARVFARIKKFHAVHPMVMISDDGGESDKNIAKLAQAGVTRFCVGSALSSAKDPGEEYARLQALASAI